LLLVRKTRDIEDLLISESEAETTQSKGMTRSTDSPIFIVGLSRSGTTLLSRMLDAHSNIAIFPETGWYLVLDCLGCIREFTNPLQTSLFLNEVWKSLRFYRDPAARIVADEASKQSRYVGPTVHLLEKLGRAYAKERHAEIWGEKTPGHVLWLPQIRELFPRSRILFMVRDPRDVLVSYDDRWNRGRRDTDYLIRTAALLKFHLVHLLYRPVFPREQVRWVKYESLAAHPAAELEQICDFLGVNFETSMLAFYQRHQNIENEMPEGHHHRLLSKPATTEQIGRYQRVLTSSQIALVERLLEKEMRALDYSISNGSGDAFTAHEEKAFKRAEVYYERMLAGDIRRRLRRRGMLKLQAYRMFGRALDCVPSWRVATTDRDWRVLTTETVKPEPLQLPPDISDIDREVDGSQKVNYQSEMGRIFQQSGIVFAGTILTAALGYVFRVYLARVLGAEALGLYALGMTIISFLGIVNVLGLPDSAVRFVAQYVAAKRVDGLRSLLWNGVWILVAVNLILAALLLKSGPWVVKHFYHSPQLARYLPLFALIMITGTLNGFFGKVLAGYRQVGRRTMITRGVASPITIAVTVLLITLGGGLWGYLVAQIVSAVVVLVLLVRLVWHLTPVAARSPDMKRIWIEPEVWSFSAAMFGVGIMEFFIGQTDRVALGFFRGAHAVGIYTMATALIAYEPIILQSVNQIFAPVISDLHTRGEHALLGRLFQTLTKWMLGLTLPLAIVMIAYARPIMRIFGHDFEAGWPILVIGTCGQLVNCGVGSVGNLLLMSGNQRRLIRVQGVMAVVMVLLSVKLIPIWGALGAAVAAAITNVGVNAWNLVEVRKALKLSPYNRSYLKLLPSVGSALLITLLISKVSLIMRIDWLGIVLALVLAYAAFSIVTLALGLDADDRLIANAVWSRLQGFLTTKSNVSAQVKRGK
jgi:O-antigen/teichoic acid export membrane protein